MDIQRAGSYSRYQFEDGKTIVGWNFGELPEGLLISMDPDGNDVRLSGKDIPRGPASRVQEQAFQCRRIPSSDCGNSTALFGRGSKVPFGA
jgi:hypothetical protein